MFFPLHPVIQFGIDGLQQGKILTVCLVLMGVL